MANRMTGLQLSEDFYRADVRPLLDAAHPRLRHAAGLMGRGSEVLGYDDEMSTDHDWTARVTVFLDTADADQVDPLQHDLRATLPSTFRGVPTTVEVATVAGYIQRELGLDVAQPWDAHDWLSVAEHRLCALTSGGVFHDQVGLGAVRERLAYYPRDVWYYLLSAGWWRVHPEMNLVGRSGYAGDDLGSALIAADMVAGLTHLAFLVERRYAPYRKWFGTAFTTLDLSAALAPELHRVLSSVTWEAREHALAAAYAVVATAFNALGITDPLPLERLRLWDRPFTVLWADYPSALAAKVTDPSLLALMRQWPPASGVDQVRDTLWAPRCQPAVRQLVGYQR